MYTVFYKREFDPNDYSFQIKEDEMKDNQYVVDISKLGNISHFYFSEAFHNCPEEIVFIANLNIWFSRFFLYKDFIDFVGDNKTDVSEVLTGQLSIFLEGDILFNYISHNNLKLKYGKKNFFYYNPDKQGISISFTIPTDNSFMTELP